MQKLDGKKLPQNKIEAPALLTANKARESLNNLHGWQLTDDHKRIYREFILLDFLSAVDLIDRIALIAEAEKHHPDIHLTQYRNLRVGLTTHDAGGLSEKDFTVALKINDLPILIHKHNNGVTIDQQSQHQDKPIKKRHAKSLVAKKNDNKAKETQVKKSPNRIVQSLKKS